VPFLCFSVSQQGRSLVGEPWPLALDELHTRSGDISRTSGG